MPMTDLEYRFPQLRVTRSLSLRKTAQVLHEEGFSLEELHQFFSERGYATHLIQEDGHAHLWVGERGEEYSPDKPQVKQRAP